MIKLCGFGVSNYYNKIKLVLLEKGIAFSEEPVFPSQDEALLVRSPLGAIPFLETEQGFISESQVMLEYLEDRFPEKALYPEDSFERAKCRELIQHLELNVELVVRRLYKEAFFGGSVSDEIKEDIKEKAEAGLKCVNRLSKFSPYILGEHFSAADCVAWVHFFMISQATQKIYGEDYVAKFIPNVATYLQRVESRPMVQKTAADRAAAIADFFANK